MSFLENKMDITIEIGCGDIVQLVLNHGDPTTGQNLIVTRIGKVRRIGYNSIILEPHGDKNLISDVAGLLAMEPIDLIKEIILLRRNSDNGKTTTEVNSSKTNTDSKATN